MFEVILFTNRSLIVFGPDGKQDAHFQSAVDSYEIDQQVLDELLVKDCSFSLAKWGEWRHNISKKEFEYLLGKRTREKDIADLEREACSSD